MKPSNKYFEFEAIGYIESCFTQKFTIPRQPGLIQQAKATLHLLPEFSHPDIVRGMEQYSHIWVIFVFHESQWTKNKNTVRPPRLGGNEKMGVFATRANFRPNPIGQSVVRLEKIEIQNGRIMLQLGAVDILDGSPVLDIKPYIPYADSLPEARAGMAAEPPKKQFSVMFSERAKTQLVEAEQQKGSEFGALIVAVLSYDTRPAYYANREKKTEFRSRLYDYELTWAIDGGCVLVKNLIKNEN